jgi:hypothetical protein
MLRHAHYKISIQAFTFSVTRIGRGYFFVYVIARRIRIFKNISTRRIVPTPYLMQMGVLDLDT